MKFCKELQKRSLKHTIKEKREIPISFKNAKLSLSRRSAGLLDFENVYPIIFTSGESKFFNQFLDSNGSLLPRAMATDTPHVDFSTIAPYSGCFKYKIIDKRKIVKS